MVSAITFSFRESPILINLAFVLERLTAFNWICFEIIATFIALSLFVFDSKAEIFMGSVKDKSFAKTSNILFGLSVMEACIVAFSSALISVLLNVLVCRN